ncbi:hypothetical protein FRC00_004124 [Tulasnella sp. 408]|nr:hypothetical protein FRC00_004124 [Tulasnella sp. 408]
MGGELSAANALHGLGQIYLDQSKYEEAERALREAHEIFSRIGDEEGVANALDDLGEIPGASDFDAVWNTKWMKSEPQKA